MGEFMNRIRAVCFIVYFVILTLIMGLGAMPIRVFKRHEAALRYAKLWSSLTLLGLKTFCRIRVRVIGAETCLILPALSPPSIRPISTGSYG
ncbi:hypothetical protein [Asaia prunellae]|uniref:hypothetical protein n=1 Tax=Asaia prunellae TaxID=610245 RepID=UPI0034E27334